MNYSLETNAHLYGVIEQLKLAILNTNNYRTVQILLKKARQMGANVVGALNCTKKELYAIAQATLDCFMSNWGNKLATRYTKLEKDVKAAIADTTGVMYQEMVNVITGKYLSRGYYYERALELAHNALELVKEQGYQVAFDSVLSSIFKYV